MVWSLIAGALSGASNAALLAVINSVLKGKSAAGPMLLWAFIGLCTMLPVSRYFSELVLNALGQGALFTLRMELSRKILAAPLRHLEQIGPARLLAVLTDDVPNITGTVLVLPILCMNATVALGCLVYMGILSPLMLAIVLGFMVIGILSYQLPVLRAQIVFRKARQEEDEILGHFRALTEGTKELKIHSDRRHAFLDDVLRSTAASYQTHNIAGMKIYTAAASWGQTLVFVVVGLILFALPKFQDLSMVTLTGYTISLLYLMTPLQIILNMLPTLGRANVALNNVRDLGLSLSAQGSEEVVPATSPSADWRKLELVEVTHTYRREGESSDFVLGPLSLSFQPGELVFIVGGNGSGKTTMAKLLIGLYAPESGEIRLSDRPVSTPEDRESYRQLFSVVFSDFYLFDQLLGLIGAGVDDRARRYLEELRLTHKVNVEDGRFSTTDLSQGQRKRLALLTAYLEDRPIYLFDEWAADQDPYFKEVFYLHLLPDLKARHKTIFVISHDDRYYHVA
ncbi:MAG TPA: cyclic peptide export ABC transporter, partial [Nitrospira sp.]|nr:cyclic peptide export ABC transporter [Nitrospira sp.]